VPVFVALLRGVNVGRHRRIRMEELRATLAGAGFRDVCTVGQSGNVIVAAAHAPERLARELADALGVDVVVRTRDELARLLRADPLRALADNGSRALVTLFGAPLPAAAVRAMRAAAGGHERIAVRGRDVYSWHPNGIHASPLASAVAAAAAAHGGTNRNRNTLEKLRAAADLR
jgi:uncharacterized protein (DUF1697 family)